MGRVNRFEELIAWQKARALTVRIYEATRRGGFARDFGLARRIRCAEGYERGSREEFHRFLYIAKGSCAEVRCQLYVAHDVGSLTSDELSELLDQAEEVSRVIGGLRASLSRPRA